MLLWKHQAATGYAKTQTSVSPLSNYSSLRALQFTLLYAIVLVTKYCALARSMGQVWVAPVIAPRSAASPATAAVLGGATPASAACAGRKPLRGSRQSPCFTRGGRVGDPGNRVHHFNCLFLLFPLVTGNTQNRKKNTLFAVCIPLRLRAGTSLPTGALPKSPLRATCCLHSALAELAVKTR